MDREEAGQLLYETRLMRSPKEVQQFEDARVALYEEDDPAVLPYFLGAFDDGTAQHEVMWGLVHEVEGFETATYLRELAAAAPAMRAHAEEWLEVLHERILASDDGYTTYRDLLRELRPESVDAIRVILQGLVRKKAPIGERAQELLQELSS